MHITAGLGLDETNDTAELSPGEILPASVRNDSGQVPLPFIININSSEAFLSTDNFNGIQPQDAGTYICVANGEVRETVEIVVLGKEYIVYTATTILLSVLLSTLCSARATGFICLLPHVTASY